LNVKNLTENKLDRIDKAILEHLQRNARMPNVALSKAVHLSPSPCLERVKRLEKLGYIKGYNARLDADLLGVGKLAFIQVSLNRTTESEFLDFKKDALSNPHIAECHMVAGGYDYILKVRFDEMHSYRSVLEQIVKFPNVNQTNTYLVIEEVKAESEIPIGNSQSQAAYP